ncbi:MAG TPA: FtsX-like permease family protein [Rectinemataceae bacterium]|nr:FtsX-like permease family protein [Rectinemataceae bacterium]
MVKTLLLALRFASHRGLTSIAAVASLAIGTGSLAAFLGLRANTVSSSGAIGVPALGNLALAVALFGAVGFVLLVSLRMRARRKGCAMLKAVGATSLSLFFTLMIEAFALALVGAALSLLVSSPLLILAHQSLAIKSLEPGFLATFGLAYSMLVALFTAFPAMETTLHCARAEGSDESGGA